MKLYQQIAQQLEQAIRNGIYQPGQRLPGVRPLSQQYQVSISTIVQAQRQLENAGLLLARPRSGYFVRASGPARQQPEPAGQAQPKLLPVAVSGQALVLQLAQASNQPGFIPLGAAVPALEFLPVRALQRSVQTVARQQIHFSCEYVFPPGVDALKQAISKRLYFAGATVPADDILITSGCQEALVLALQAVAQAGDVIAVESPTFYGLLQAIESLGMRALEIPTDAQQGMSLAALELALEQWPVKACVLIPNYSNPLGSLMPVAHKQQLAELAKRFGVMLIEDDVYGDLGFTGTRPPSLLSFDKARQQVIACSSFAKTIAPGLRVGWMVMPPDLFKRVEYLKFVRNLAAPTLSQLALAHFLEQGGYERYLAQVRPRYLQQVERFATAVSDYFPAQTRVTRPAGGFVLWVELPEAVDALKLTQWALQRQISIAPGPVFSAAQKYQHFIRLTCAQPWADPVEQALQQLGAYCRGVVGA